MKITALITARGGSKGLPRKNVLPLAGKPLIAWTIEAALASGCLGRVILSTDDAEIAQVAQDWGAEVPFMRPAALAQDDSDHLSVVLHALDWLAEHDDEPDYLLLLQPTSPLRTAADIQAVVAQAQQDQPPAIIGVCAAQDHPYLVKRIAADGTLSAYVESDIGYLRRQALPPAYVINGAIYLNQVATLRTARTFLPTGARAYIMPTERSLDVDTAWDLHLVSLLLAHPFAG